MAPTLPGAPIATTVRVRRGGAGPLGLPGIITTGIAQ